MAEINTVLMDGERLAKLEQQVDDTQKMVDRRLTAHEKDLTTIRDDVHAIRLQLSGFKGFWQGIVLTISTIAAAVGALTVTIWDRLTGGQS